MGWGQLDDPREMPPPTDLLSRPRSAPTDYLAKPRKMTFTPAAMQQNALAKMMALEDEGGSCTEDDNMGHGTNREEKLMDAVRENMGRDHRVPRVATTTRPHGTVPTQAYVSARGASARRQESARATAEMEHLQKKQRMKKMSSYREIRYGQVSSRVVGGPNRPDSARRPDSSRAGDTASVASAIASGRLARQTTRSTLIKAPSVAEIQEAIKDRPYLTRQIQALHRDPDMSREQRLQEIVRIIREVRPDTLHTEPTALEKLQSGYTCTAPQKAGRRAAIQDQVRRVKEANKARHSQPQTPHWRNHGGEAVETLLESVDLVDARFLVSLNEQGGTLPCWSTLPDAAKIGQSSVWRLWGWTQKASLPVLVLSCPWLDGDHPDREGEMLALLVPLLRVMLSVCGGEHYTVGVLWDYASLPQPIRSPAEHARFVEGLRTLTTWYTHPYTHVLLMTQPLPEVAPSGEPYSNVARPYGARGWCDLERRMACLSTVSHCLWDLSLFEPESLSGSAAPSESGSTTTTGAPAMTADLQAMVAIRTFGTMRAQLMLRSREPPLPPTLFAHTMRKKVDCGLMSFLEPTDMLAVLEMYEAGFVSFFENFRKFDPSGTFNSLQGLEWGPAEAKVLATALAYASEKCKLRKSGTVRLRFEGNAFDEKGEKAIRTAIQFSKVIADVRF